MFKTRICICCGHKIEGYRSNYCNRCTRDFVEFIKPCARAARFLIRCRFDDITARELHMVINTWDCGVSTIGDIRYEAPNDEFVDLLLDECEMDIPDEPAYIPVNYKHMTIEFGYYDWRDSYYGREYTSYFRLSGRRDTLYKTVIFNVITTPSGDIVSLPDGIIDDILELEPLYALRYLINHHQI